jgi:hypothetical protein
MPADKKKLVVVPQPLQSYRLAIVGHRECSNARRSFWISRKKLATLLSTYTDSHTNRDNIIANMDELLQALGSLTLDDISSADLEVQLDLLCILCFMLF